ncbi:MAG: hypothetical protein HC876_19885 [Chloroflexaceae bacterium]|nr:hypothetical protein [Chloroflexaceae bacterium]
MPELRIKSLDAVLSIQSDDDRVIEYFRDDLMLRTHIPGYNIATETPEWHIHHTSNEKGEFSSSEELREMNIEGIFQKHTSEHDFTFLSLTALSRIHEEKNRITLHSSAVSDGANTHIFVGGRGGGKSILATELIYKRGMMLVSGENTVLAATQALSGTAILSNRIPCIAQRYPELLDKSKGIYQEDYGTKCYLPESLLIKKALLPQRIAGIYFINVNDNWSNMQKAPIPLHAAIYELLLNSSSYITGAGHTIMKFSQPHPDLETKQLRQRRVSLLHSLIENVKIEEIRGSVNQIANYICGEEQ